MSESIGWATIAIWIIWLVLYWEAGAGLVANFVRFFRLSSLSYNRFFILGLVMLSNIILWSGYLLLRGRIDSPATSSWLGIPGLVLTAVGASGTFCCRRQMRESWSAHTTLHANHRLVDKGPYGVVRHPIYAFACLMTAGTVLVFPLWWNVLAGAGMMFLYVLKSGYEEGMLMQELAGYADYTRRVRYRLLPFLW